MSTYAELDAELRSRWNWWVGVRTADCDKQNIAKFGPALFEKQRAEDALRAYMSEAAIGREWI